MKKKIMNAFDKFLFSDLLDVIMVPTGIIGIMAGIAMLAIVLVKG